LDTVTLTEDIFVIPTATNVAFQQDFGGMDQASNPVEITFSQKLRLATLAGISLPRADTLTILAIPRTPLIDQEMPYQIFDKNGIPYFERVDYLTIGDGEFSTTVENEMLMDLDSVVIQMKNKDGSIIAESFYETIPAGETRSSSSDLPDEQHKQLQDSIIVAMSAILAGTDGAPLVIPANTDPYMTLTVGVSIDEIESFTGKPEPIETRTAQKLPESNNTIKMGILGEVPSESRDTNLVHYQIENGLPINMNMEIVFLNFYTESGALSIDATFDATFDGEEPSREEGSIRLDLDTLASVDATQNMDTTTVIDSFIVVTTVTILPDPGDTVSTIPLDFGVGVLDFKLSISVLKFKKIKGSFDARIVMPPITIRDIPSGFGNVDFSDVWLKLSIYNKIRANFYYYFDIVGYKEGQFPVTVSTNGDISKYSSGSAEISEINIDIDTVFNLVPDSIKVFGEVQIPTEETTVLVVGDSLWGTYEVEVPFCMKINDMTFIPVSSSKLSPMDAETRLRLQSGLIEAAIISEITNDFPLSGRVDILISTYDYFPLYADSLDSGYQFINDTIFAITDTGNISVVIDTLVTIELPEPVLDQYQRVRTPGYVYQSSVIDSAKIDIIVSDETHYIRPRIHFNGTDDFVYIGYNDIIRIVTLFSMTLEVGTMFGPVESEEDSV
ncbi:MAG: hypothetical protein ABIK30_16580, partial [bacterium]